MLEKQKFEVDYADFHDDLAKSVLIGRYFNKDSDGDPVEGWSGMCARVAKAVASVEKDEVSRSMYSGRFFDMMSRGDFLPNSPVLMNFGQPGALGSACFVLPIEDDMHGIYQTLKDTAIVQKAGGGTGYNFSNLRPFGTKVGSYGQSSGVVSFISVYNESGMAINQGGRRRSASMAMLDVSHPELIKFIRAKEEDGKLSNFNLSVAITDQFMDSVITDPDTIMTCYHQSTGACWLDHDGGWHSIASESPPASAVRIGELFDMIVDHAWKNGEPGVFFVDRANEKNPVKHLGDIVTTNPCVTGDTKVWTIEGPKTFRELHKSGKPIYVPTESSKGDLRFRIMSPPRITKRSAKLVSIKFSNGYSLRCTEGHRLILDSGEDVEASQLRPGDRIRGRHKEPTTRFYVSSQIVESVELLSEREDVYNGSVKEFHRYFIALGESDIILSKNCGEYAAIPYSSCILGSVNLSNFVKDGAIENERLMEMVQLAIRFLDNVIDVNTYPIKEIEDVTMSTRPMGLGVMGFADMLLKLGVRYGSDKSVDLAESVMEFINSIAHSESIKLCEERGIYQASHGDAKRNCQVTTIAPTGTISMLAGCSSGIEPVFSWGYKRRAVGNQMNVNHPIAAKWMYDNPGKPLPDYFVTANDITADEHIKIQAAFQRNCDNGVSKTINMPSSATRDDVARAIVMAWEMRCNGITVYRDGSRANQVLETKKEEPETIATPEPILDDDVVAGRGVIVDRPRITDGATGRYRVGCGSLYVTYNSINGVPCEVFVNSAEGGGCAANSKALGMLISLGLRAGIDPDEVIRTLKKVSCPACRGKKGLDGKSCADVVARAMEEMAPDSDLYDDFVTLKHQGVRSVKPDAAITSHTRVCDESVCLSMGVELQDTNTSVRCPDCGWEISHESGCVVCYQCGFSKCS